MGSNADGRLGLGTPTTQDMVNRATPTQVSSLPGVLAATFGYDHTLVLLEDGTVRAFRDNSLGQLGDGSIEDRHYPVEVPGLTDIIQVVGGSKHSLALKRDGTVWAWGGILSGTSGKAWPTLTRTPHLSWSRGSPRSFTWPRGAIACSPSRPTAP